jgi:curved DNA-binding protein CbpA
MGGEDFYAILGVSADSEDVVITAAYKALMKKYHPDTNRGNAAAEARAKKINQAYDVLRDPGRRAAYDARRRGGGSAGTASPPPPPPPSPPPPPPKPRPGPRPAPPPGGKQPLSGRTLAGWGLLAVAGFGGLILLSSGNRGGGTTSSYVPSSSSSGASSLGASNTASEIAAPAMNTAAPVEPSFAFGTYGSSFGRMQIGPYGGTYSSGRFSDIRTSGNVVEGIWEGSSQQTCADGRKRGRFRFTGGTYGFTGSWSYCDGPLDRIWNGWVPGPVRVYNNCPSEVEFYFRWADPQGVARGNGPWSVPANGSRLLDERNGSLMTQIRTADTGALLYAERLPSRVAIASGPSSISVSGRTLPMQFVTLSPNYGEYTFSISCASQGSTVTSNTNRM